MTSEGPSFCEAASVVAMRSRRSCEHTTAFGAPVVPDVNSRKIWSDGFTFVVGSGASAYGRERVAVRRLVDHEDTSVRRAEVEAVEQFEVAGLGDDELALGVIDVAFEPFAAARGVDADDRRSAQRGGARPHREVGQVLEQQPDVRRAIDAHRRRTKRPGPSTAHPLVVRPRLVFEEQSDVRVAGACPDVVGEDTPAHAPPPSIVR